MKRILIIEDEKTLNDMYALKFKKEWFEVESAYNGLEGLTKISSHDPDVILLDIMMPSMNGFETLEVIKSQTSSDCKIIMFTNVVDKDKLDDAMGMGADDYLIKSDTTPAEAVIRVKEHLGMQTNSTQDVLYVEPGHNSFKMKNPDGGEDITIDIHIGL